MLSLEGKLWPNSKPNMLNVVHNSDLLRGIIDSFKYSEAYSEVSVLEKESFSIKYLSLSFDILDSVINSCQCIRRLYDLHAPPKLREPWLSGCHLPLIPQTPPVDALIVRKGIAALSALMLVQIFLPSMDVSRCITM